MAEAKRDMMLPTSVVEPADVRRLSRELESVDEFLRQAEIRKGGTPTNMPRTTKTLDALAEANGLNLLVAIDRAKAAGFLDALVRDAPVVHVSFAAEPSAAFTAKILTWLRENIHPLLLVQIGLQPSIAAGCIVRTNSKVFDFSLRQYMLGHRDMLTKAINEMDSKAQPAQATAAPKPVPAQEVAS
jgi:hypothetical protein